MHIVGLVSEWVTGIKLRPHEKEKKFSKWSEDLSLLKPPDDRKAKLSRRRNGVVVSGTSSTAAAETIEEDEEERLRREEERRKRKGEGRKLLEAERGFTSSDLQPSPRVPRDAHDKEGTQERACSPEKQQSLGSSLTQPTAAASSAKKDDDGETSELRSVTLMVPNDIPSRKETEEEEKETNDGAAKDGAARREGAPKRRPSVVALQTDSSGEKPDPQKTAAQSQSDALKKMQEETDAAMPFLTAGLLDYTFHVHSKSLLIRHYLGTMSEQKEAAERNYLVGKKAQRAVKAKFREEQEQSREETPLGNVEIDGGFEEHFEATETVGRALDEISRETTLREALDVIARGDHEDEDEEGEREGGTGRQKTERNVTTAKRTAENQKEQTEKSKENDGKEVPSTDSPNGRLESALENREDDEQQSELDEETPSIFDVSPLGPLQNKRGKGKEQFAFGRARGVMRKDANLTLEEKMRTEKHEMRKLVLRDSKETVEKLMVRRPKTKERRKERKKDRETVHLNHCLLLSFRLCPFCIHVFVFLSFCSSLPVLLLCLMVYFVSPFSSSLFFSSLSFIF